MAKKVYVWELPVRLTHWLIVACLLVLSATGIYISSPFITVASTASFVMGWIRFIHFVTAYVFIITVAVRIYWAFAGNSFSSWHAFLPFNRERTATMFEQLKFYSLITTKPPSDIGHTPLAGIVYFLLFLLYIVSALTGFALYSVHAPGGTMSSLFGWVFSIMSMQMTRLVHHFVMWLILYFAIIHLYIVFLLNSVEKNSLLGSIFDGYKIGDMEKH